MALLDNDETTSVVANQVEKLVGEVQDLIFGDWDALLPQVLRCKSLSFFQKLADAVARGFLVAVIDGSVSDVACRRFQDDEALNPWFASVDSRTLRVLIAGGKARYQKASWQNAWRWVSLSPDSLFYREKEAIPELISGLLQAGSEQWPNEVVSFWVAILDRSGKRSDRIVNTYSCVHRRSAFRSSMSACH